MKIQNIIGWIALLSLIVFLSFSQKNNNDDSENKNIWVKFSSETMGIGFEHPNYLQSFPVDSIYLKEEDAGPGFVYIQKTYIQKQTLEEAIKNLYPEKLTVIKKIMVDGIPAVVTIRDTNDHDDPKDDKIVFVVYNDTLYRIYIRWIDVDRFLKSFKFIRYE